jgi:hypothetical protein
MWCFGKENGALYVLGWMTFEKDSCVRSTIGDWQQALTVVFFFFCIFYSIRCTCVREKEKEIDLFILGIPFVSSSLHHHVARREIGEFNLGR